MKLFKKQGGKKLLKQYWKGGAIFTAVGEFLLLGKSRTSLELLSLAASLKTKQKLERKYKKHLTQFNEKYIETEHKGSKKIWITAKILLSHSTVGDILMSKLPTYHA